MYSKVIQIYIYVYLFFFKFFSHLGCYIILSRIPCVVQEVLVAVIIFNVARNKEEMMEKWRDLPLRAAV